ncbi:hypothetical protein KDX38_23310 [Pseudomonas sp. CDFA 602]|uniref:hypothetical protein n=1 Tax=Pseudomonas californiensis TaxID=2829823 RepID=UPI001E43666F|nr:hypothetical protein [Pseudomonas californiensis]MCD5996522.1 hypothetical protein [Pseudomonas californiensis]MCD6002121.1 hypothetical protein [Pseudomonas californiensis]
MTDSNNPLGKLLSYVVKARSQDGSIRICDAWAATFDVEPNDLAGLSRKFTDFNDLVDASITTVQESVKSGSGLYLSHLDRLKKALSQHSFSGQWGSFLPKLDDKLVQALEFGDHVLRTSYPAADEEVRARIIDFVNRLNELLSECLESDLPNDVKALFIKNLEGLRASLIDYLSGGPNKIDEAIDQIAGSVVRVVRTEPEHATEHKGLMKRILETLTSANEITAKTQELISTSSPVIDGLLKLIS